MDKPRADQDDRAKLETTFEALLALNDMSVLPERRAAIVVAVGELRQQAQRLRVDAGTEPFARDDSRQI